MLNTEFHYDDGTLHCEDQSLADLADEHGTPLYVYSENHFIDRYETLDEVLSPVDHTICFAMKSNGNLGVLNSMAEAGCGFDIVSGGELRRVLEAGGDPSDVVYAGVAKTEVEQRLALEHDIKMFNVESMPELEQLDEVAGDMGKEGRVAFRVNPDVDAKTHDKITTGKKENKFGVPIAKIEEYVERAESLPNIDFKGLHFHIGSQITTIEPFEEVAEKIRNLFDDLREQGHELDTLNMGGGLGIQYRNEDTLDPQDWADVVVPLAQDLGVDLIVEPGRFIMGNAGVLVTETVYVKKSVTKDFVVVDAGMNDLIRPAMYDSFHDIKPVQPTDNEEITADVVGPICETGDYFGKDRSFPEPEEGNYFSVMSAGAYGMAMASQYNAFPRPAEVMVTDDGVDVVRERESYEDLWSGEPVS
jgi:diaminopimelate decarboxylase